MTKEELNKMFIEKKKAQMIPAHYYCTHDEVVYNPTTTFCTCKRCGRSIRGNCSIEQYAESLDGGIELLDNFMDAAKVFLNSYETKFEKLDAFISLMSRVREIGNDLLEDIKSAVITTNQEAAKDDKVKGKKSKAKEQPNYTPNFFGDMFSPYYTNFGLTPPNIGPNPVFNQTQYQNPGTQQGSVPVTPTFNYNNYKMSPEEAKVMNDYFKNNFKPEVKPCPYETEDKTEEKPKDSEQ